jgi:hypothetical protein
MKQKKAEAGVDVFVILTLVVILCLIIAGVFFSSDTVKEKCKSLCDNNGEIYYDSTNGAYSNDVCLCKTKEGRIVDYVIG